MLGLIPADPPANTLRITYDGSLPKIGVTIYLKGSRLSLDPNQLKKFDRK